MELTELRNILKDRVKTVYIATFFILAVFAYFLLIKYDVSVFHKLRNTLHERNENLRTLKTITKDREYADKFNSEFIIKEGAHWLVGIITKAAKRESVTLDLVKPFEENATSGYKKVKVLAEGKAPYHNAARFISNLENSSKYLVVEELKLGSEYISTSEGREFFRGKPQIPGPRELEEAIHPPAGMEVGEMPFYPDMMMRERKPPLPPGIRGEKELVAIFRLVVTGFNVEK